MKKLLIYLLRILRRRPPASASDPFAWRPAPVKPRPKRSGGAVAVAEPDND